MMDSDQHNQQPQQPTSKTIAPITSSDSTRRLKVKKQSLSDAYSEPANFLEIDVTNPITHGIARSRYTDYEIRMRVST